MADDSWVYFEVDEAAVRRERAKARELRRTPYFQELFRRGVCHYCGKKFPVSELTLDHVLPLSRGGRSTRGNMVVCCHACNAAKRMYTPAEMILNALNESEETNIDKDK